MNVFRKGDYVTRSMEEALSPEEQLAFMHSERFDLELYDFALRLFENRYSFTTCPLLNGDVAQQKVTETFIKPVTVSFNESSDPIVVARELCHGKVKSCFVLAEAAVAIGQNKLYDKELKDWMWSDEFKYLFL